MDFICVSSGRPLAGNNRYGSLNEHLSTPYHWFNSAHSPNLIKLMMELILLFNYEKVIFLKDKARHLIGILRISGAAGWFLKVFKKTCFHNPRARTSMATWSIFDLSSMRGGSQHVLMCTWNGAIASKTWKQLWQIRMGLFTVSSRQPIWDFAQ